MSLTKSDKNWIASTVDSTVGKAIEQNNKRIFAYMNQTFAKQTDMDEVKAILTDHDSKFDRILDMLDTILGNQVKDRQELDIVSSRLSNHEGRIQALEKA
jgi:hypothetical protein